MTRIVKFLLGSGVLSMGLLALVLTSTGCSGDSGKSIEEVKVNGGMSPGEYRDSVDPITKAKAKGARPKR